MIYLSSLIIFDTIWRMAKSHVRDIRKYKNQLESALGLRYSIILVVKFEQCFL